MVSSVTVNQIFADWMEGMGADVYRLSALVVGRALSDWRGRGDAIPNDLEDQCV